MLELYFLLQEHHKRSLNQFITTSYEREHPFYLNRHNKRHSFSFPIILYHTTQILESLLPQSISPTSVDHRVGLLVVVERTIGAAWYNFERSELVLPS